MHVKALQILALAMASQQASAEVNANSLAENLNQLAELSSQTNDMVGKFQADTVVNEAPKVISNFRNIVRYAMGDTKGMNGDSAQPSSTPPSSAGAAKGMNSTLEARGMTNSTMANKAKPGNNGQPKGGKPKGDKSKGASSASTPTPSAGDDDMLAGILPRFLEEQIKKEPSAATPTPSAASGLGGLVARFMQGSSSKATPTPSSAAEEDPLAGLMARGEESSAATPTPSAAEDALAGLMARGDKKESSAATPTPSAAGAEDALAGLVARGDKESSPAATPSASSAEDMLSGLAARGDKKSSSAAATPTASSSSEEEGDPNDALGGLMRRLFQNNMPKNSTVHKRLEIPQGSTTLSTLATPAATPAAGKAGKASGAAMKSNMTMEARGINANKTIEARGIFSNKTMEARGLNMTLHNARSMANSTMHARGMPSNLTASSTEESPAAAASSPMSSGAADAAATGASAMPELSEAEQKSVCGAFQKFADNHAALMKNLMNKDSVISKTMFSTPMGSVARVMEDTGINNLANTVRMVAPSCKFETEQSVEKLNMAVSKVVNAYNTE